MNCDTIPLAGRRRFPFPADAGNFRRMSTITAILESDADGTLHLPLPAELRHGKVKVTATLEPSVEVPSPLQATPERKMAGTPLDALKELRKRGGLRHIIPYPVAWQREQRRERPLPGRD